MLDTEAEAEFDNLAKLAATACHAPVCLINLIDAGREWCKAAVGRARGEAPLETSICAAAIRRPGLTVIPDTQKDPRSRRSPLVAGPEGLRFYAGAPVVTREGLPLGTLCVLDTRARADGLDDAEAGALALLAAQVMAVLELRRSRRDREATETRLRGAAQRLRESERRFRTMAESMPQIVWSANAAGEHDYFNSRWYEFTGLDPADSDRANWKALFHAEDRPEAGRRWRQALATGQAYEVEYRLRRADGVYRWILGRAAPLRDEDGRVERWLGTCTDIDDIRQAVAARELLSQELSHRIKNIFAVVSSLISLSARRHPDAQAFAAELRERVSALAKAHELVRLRGEAEGAQGLLSSLHALLAALLAPFAGGVEGRLRVEGGDLSFDDGAATPLALVFHELATNAAKYGAWSVAGGEVAIVTTVDAEVLRVAWRERGGPRLSGPPDKTGFGATLAQLSVQSQLHGRIERVWEPDGLIVRLVIPLAALNRRSQPR